MKIDGKQLREAVKALNGASLIGKPINAFQKSNEVLLEEFAAKMVEIEAAGMIDDIPDLAFDYYQVQFPAKSEPFESKQKPPKKRHVNKISWHTKYGVRPDTMNFKFLDHLRRQPSTMPEVMNASWNKGHRPFYNLFKKLADKGLAKKDANGCMSLI